MNGKTSLKHTWGSPGLADIRIRIKGCLMPGIYLLQDKLRREISFSEVVTIVEECYTAYTTGGTAAAMERFRRIERRLIGNAAIGKAMERV